MDPLHERLDALEQQVQTLTQHTHTVTRRLHWWRGLACGAVVLAVLTWALPSSKTADAQSETIANRLSALQDVIETLEGILRHVKVVTTPDGLKEVVITGANLRIVNGLGSTGCTDDQGESIPNCPNGLGNLIVGYNELRDLSTCTPPDPFCKNTRTGSHNMVVGMQHNFSRFGGLVVGQFNTISGDFAAVSGGKVSIASGPDSSVSGGFGNIASGPNSSVSGGEENTASGGSSSVSGGFRNIASGFFAAITGGQENTASGDGASSVSGGFRNIASGQIATVSGGQNITQATEAGWAAGSEADEVVVGNVRSP
jgi:hypothetical protein